MAQYSQRTQPMHRPGQTDHGHGGGALAYGGKPAVGAVVAPGQPRPPTVPYNPQPYPPAQLRLHQPGYGSAALSYRDSSYVRGGGAVGAVGGVGGVGAGAGEYRGGGRVSMLGAAYLPPPAPQHHPPPADPPPFKKIRLTADRTSVPHHQPLRVDTREQVNSYNNTVEVLSPNPQSEPSVEDQSFRTTKDDLLQQISKVDREMALAESSLQKLKKKQEDLEQTASKPARAEEPEEVPFKHRSLAQCVYADNRKKATSAHAVLSHLGPPVQYPLYNQPQDTEVYHENIRRHRSFRKRLAEHIRKVKLEAEKREDALAEAYSQRAAEWLRRVDRIEQGQKRKAKDARNREFFEKVFPELRKQREERERFNRLGARVKSEAELEEIADGLHEQEHEDKKMRSLTVVPPLLRDPSDTTPIYIDTNRRCMDMEAEHKDLQLRNVWSQGEREMFREKYLQHPKNFGQIASFLPRKTVRDCVRFYYLSKKAENYKQLLRKPRQRRSARNPPRPAPEPELSAGVTTRLQRSQGTVARAVGEAKEPSLDEPPTDPTLIPVPTSPAAPAAPAHPQSTELIRTPPLPPSPPPGSSAPPAPMTSTPTPLSVATSPAAAPTPPALDVPMPTTTADVTITITAVTAASTTSGPSTPTTSTSVTSSTICTVGTTLTPTGCSAPPTPQPAQPPTPTPTQPPPTPETAVTERIGTPSSTTTITTTTITMTSSNCAVCSMPGATRTVSRSRAIHYGLKEEAVGARVCEPCHCRCVRSRYTRCPVPTCPGPRVRAKRLRHLPPRWHDLSLELKRPLMEEFEIPSELSKCCLACFKRITRRLETVGEGGGAPEPSEEEAARFRALLRDHGTAWDRLAAASGRTPARLKAFYFTYRKKLQLDSLVSERPASASRCSSSSESPSSGDTDTASGGSPGRPPSPRAPAPAPGPRTDAAAPRRTRKDEYDSSATETADEENDAPAAKILPPTSLPTSVSSAPTSIPASITSVATSVVTSSGVVTSSAVTQRPTGPQTVRDVVLNLIEISLTRDTQPQHPSIKQHQIKAPSSCAGGREALATLSVVNSSHVGAGGGASSPQRAATITPLAHQPAAHPPHATPATQPDSDVRLLHIEPRHESLLDLSVKRPRHDQPFPHPNKALIYRNNEYTYRPQHEPERESPNQYNNKPKPVAAPPRPPLKPANPKGSITLGTPVESRFEPLRTPPEPKAGSITAGTPVHVTHMSEKRDREKLLDFYKRNSPGGAYYGAATNQPRPQSPCSFSPTGGSGYSRNPYGLEQRQIIMADFITSQQMHGTARRERERAASPQYRRDAVSVIQRHTPQYPQHPHQPHQHHHAPHPPPGHEAFTSLVDVASAATALPVPRGSQPDSKPEPKPPPQHHAAPHDIRLAMQQKFQQMPQFSQMMDRRAQSQYLDRERQMVMQRRETERAMAAMQERHAMEQQQQQQQQHHQQSQQPSQIIHDRLHMPITMNVSSQEDRRMMTSMTYSTPGKPRAQTPHHIERKDNRVPVSVGVNTSVPGPGVGPAAAAAAAAAAAGDGRPRPAEGTLTAASLIDAIITHQISQNSDQRFPVTALRECDNGTANPQLAQERPDRGPTPADRERERERERDRERDEAHAAAAHTRSIKLGELASNIITRDFCSPNTSIMHHNNRFVGSSDSYVSSGGDEWKRRDAPKHAPYLEPVSPPDNHPANRSNSNRRYSCAHAGSGGVSGGGGVLTAFDYVTNRIVEVMRSGDADERTKPIAFPTTAYAYPYSALNVATPATDGSTVTTSGSSTVSGNPGVAAPEPAPLMSAQYEPLSDED